VGEGWLSLLKWSSPLNLSKVGLFKGSMLYYLTIVCLGNTYIVVSRLGCTYRVVTLEDVLIKLRPPRNAIVPQHIKLSGRLNLPKMLVQWGKGGSPF
jgi:hypothetical protein